MLRMTTFLPCAGITQKAQVLWATCFPLPSQCSRLSGELPRRYTLLDPGCGGSRIIPAT